jgi:anti-sigma factor RsiW
MNCEQISTQLVAYMDGRATGTERRDVESHLESCGSCRTRVEEFRRLWTVLDEAPVVEPSLGFDARMRQRIAVEPRPRLWNWLVPSPRLAFAVASLAVLSVWLSSRPPAVEPSAMQSEQEFRMIKDLGVLENYDVLSNLDALSELPPAQAQPDEQSADREM